MRPHGRRVLKPGCERPRDPDHGHKSSDSGKWLEPGQRRPELRLPVRDRDHVSPPLWLYTHRGPPWLSRDAPRNRAGSKALPDSVSHFSRIISGCSDSRYVTRQRRKSTALWTVGGSSPRRREPWPRTVRVARTETRSRVGGTLLVFRRTASIFVYTPSSFVFEKGSHV